MPNNITTISNDSTEEKLIELRNLIIKEIRKDIPQGDIRSMVSRIMSHIESETIKVPSSQPDYYIRFKSKEGDGFVEMDGKEAFDYFIEAVTLNEVAGARKKVASDIFSLAHKYAWEDKTMKGSEELRAYHYYNAIHNIGELND